MDPIIKIPSYLKWHEKRVELFEAFRRELIAKLNYNFFGNEDSSSIWSGLWVIDRPYLKDGDMVYLMFDQKVVAYTLKVNVDFVTHYYRLNKDNLSILGALLDSDEPDIECCRDFELNIEHLNCKETPTTYSENGQLKLLCNALELIDRPEGHVVVIGGGGPDYSVAGLTYAALAEALPNMTFEIYDPLETAYFDRNRKIYDKPFNYDDITFRPEVTHVIDDAYYSVPCSTTWNDRVIDYTGADYTGKFTALATEGRIHLVESPFGHLVQPNALGGGFIVKDRGKVIVTDTSIIGPYDDQAILRSYKHWIVFPPTVFDNRENYKKLKRSFPNASISIKALLMSKAESREEIKTQHYYKGNEKRIYYKARTIPQVGTKCVMCHYALHCSQRLKVPPSVIMTLFVKVGCESCEGYKHKTLTYMKTLVYEMARKHPLKSTMVNTLTMKTNHTEKAILAFLALLEQREKLVIYHSVDGPRYMRVIPGTMRLPLVPDDEKNLLVTLCWFYNARCVGEHCFGDYSSRVIYVGSEYDMSEIAMLKNASISVYSKYDKTHVHVKREYFCLFIRKDIKIDYVFLDELELFVGYMRGHVVSFLPSGIQVDHDHFTWEDLKRRVFIKKKFKWREDILTAIVEWQLRRGK